MNSIEIGDFDRSEATIDNLKSNISYHKANGVNFGKRIESILKILTVLRSNKKDFTSQEIIENEIALLSSDDPEYKWIPCGPELVRFHDWLQARARHLSYREFIQVG